MTATSTLPVMADGAVVELFVVLRTTVLGPVRIAVELLLDRLSIAKASTETKPVTVPFTTALAASVPAPAPVPPTSRSPPIVPATAAVAVPRAARWSNELLLTCVCWISGTKPP
jgi:hypothetical protein